MNVSFSVGLLVLLLSILEISVSWQLLSLTNNNYMSSFIGGISCFIASSITLKFLYSGDNGFAMKIVALLSFLSAVPISVAMGSLAARYFYYPVMEACSSITDDESHCGKYFTGFSCYGNSRSFPSSYSCLSLQSERSDSTCACVTGSGDCFVFNDIPSCSAYFFDFQRILFSSLVLSILLFVMCCLQMLIALRSIQPKVDATPTISMVERRMPIYGSGGQGRPEATIRNSSVLNNGSSSNRHVDMDSALFGSNKEDEEETHDLLSDECTL